MKRVVVSAAVIICMVLSGAAPAGASTTWRSQHVPRPAGSIGYLQGVSCPSEGTCIAVGTWFRNGVQYTLAEHWDRSGWTIQPTPNPAGPTATLDDVSCTSPTNCIAVGYHTPPVVGGEHLLADHWNETSWTLQSGHGAHWRRAGGFHVASRPLLPRRREDSGP